MALAMHPVRHHTRRSVTRPRLDGTVTHWLVFDSVPAGRYDLYVRPTGPVRLTATVRGGG